MKKIVLILVVSIFQLSSTNASEGLSEKGIQEIAKVQCSNGTWQRQPSCVAGFRLGYELGQLGKGVEFALNQCSDTYSINLDSLSSNREAIANALLKMGRSNRGCKLGVLKALNN
jgi:hypothetical protein